MNTGSNNSLYDDLISIMPTGWTANRWTSEAGVNRSFFQDLRKGKEPKSSTLAKLLRAIAMTPSEFYERQAAGTLAAAKLGEPRTDYRAMPQDLISSMANARGGLYDLPTYGTAEGACDLTDDAGNLLDIDCMNMFMNEVVEYRLRPQGLMGQRNVYTLRVVGDSMEPRYFHSELTYVDPVRPPSIGDFVIIQLRNGRHEDGVDHDPDQIVRVLIKRLVKRGAGYMEFEQYNPKKTFRLQTQIIARLHRVMYADEIS
jgi:Peptidase S24-like